MKLKLLNIAFMASRFAIYGIFLQVFFISTMLAEKSRAQVKSIREVHIEIELNNVTLIEAFQKIEDLSGYEFSYDIDDLDKDVRINLKAEKKSIAEILTKIAKEASLNFRQINQNIDVRKRKRHDNAPVEIILQDHTVTGKVTDENGDALPGVNVIEKGTTHGTVTDVQGDYSIDISEGATLIFSFVGYISSEIDVGTRSIVNLAMSPDVQHLEELVVIGYGTVKKGDLTGAVSSIGEEDFNVGVNTSPQQLIQGRLPGVQITSTSGAPGAEYSIRIRGRTSISAGTDPLWVIDGVPTATPGSNLNPSDIQSIEVLKDASATAIYGSRGANGVIIITTKQGTNKKFSITYDSYLGFQSPTNLMEVLNPNEYMNILNAIIDEGGGSESQRVTEIQNGGTDWQQAVVDKNALIKRNELSFSGGSQKTDYYVSFSAHNQPGLIINSGMDAYTGRVNLTTEISEKFNLGIRLNLAYSKDNYIRTGGYNTSAGVINAATHYDPTISVYNDDGEYNRSNFIDIDNPVAIAYGNHAETYKYSAFANVFAEYQVLPTLSLKLNTGYNNSPVNSFNYVDRTTLWGAIGSGSGDVSSTFSSDYLVELTANYAKELNGNVLNVLVGTTAQYFSNISSSSYASNFASDGTLAFNLGLGDPETYIVNTNRSANSLLSYIGRANYNHQDKYLLTGTVRIDGSSRFGENNKYATFPSFAAAWKINNENFLQSIDVLSILKLRTSWGQTGNQAIGNQETQLTFSSGPLTVLDKRLISTLEPNRIANPDLKWETTEQIDIGLDFGFFNNRIRGTIDYFYKNTFDMLLNLPLPKEVGFNIRRINIGSVENKGFEFSLTSVNLVNDFKWTTSINFATIKNNITSLGPLDDIINNNTISRIGTPINSIYGWRVIGTWQLDDDFSSTNENVAPGDTKYNDVNNDGYINESDRDVIGNGFPKFTYGVFNTLSYKSFKLDFVIDGQSGVKKHNANLSQTFFSTNYRRNKIAAPYLNRWTPDNPTNEYPSFVNPTAQGTMGTSTYTVQDASYIRLANFRFSYTLPENILKNTLRNFTIYLSGQNVLTMTDFIGDPTFTSPSDAYYGTRTLMVGLQLGF